MLSPFLWELMGRTGLRQLHIDLSPNPTHEQRVSENLVPTSLETAELTQSEHGMNSRPSCTTVTLCFKINKLNVMQNKYIKFKSGMRLFVT